MSPDPMSASGFETIRYDVEGGVATITLDRPASLNSMSTELMSELHQAIDRVHDDRSIRVVVITGEGRGFCSGADLTQRADVRGSDDSGESDMMRDVFNPAIAAVYHCPVPTVARVNGVAAGGGFGLALACDIAVAARSAFFVATFGPRLGIVPDLGTSWSLPRRAGRAKALGLAMLGDRITAERAEDWGLIYATVDDDALDDEVARVCAILAETSAEAMVRIRHATDAAAGNTFDEHLGLEFEHQCVLRPLNIVEGARAFVEKRPPTFPGRG